MYPKLVLPGCLWGKGIEQGYFCTSFVGLQGFFRPSPRKVHLSTTFGGRSHLIAWLCSSLSSFGYLKMTVEPFQGAFGHLVIWINVFPMIIAPRRISRTPLNWTIVRLAKSVKSQILSSCPNGGWPSVPGELQFHRPPPPVKSDGRRKEAKM